MLPPGICVQKFLHFREQCLIKSTYSSKAKNNEKHTSGSRQVTKSFSMPKLTAVLSDVPKIPEVDSVDIVFLMVAAAVHLNQNFQNFTFRSEYKKREFSMRYG